MCELLIISAEKLAESKLLRKLLLCKRLVRLLLQLCSHGEMLFSIICWARRTQEPEVPGSIPGPATSVSPSADSRRAVVSYWQKYVHLVLVNLSGGLCLPRNSAIKLTNFDMAVYLPDSSLKWTQNKQAKKQKKKQQKKNKKNIIITLFHDVLRWRSI